MISARYPDASSRSDAVYPYYIVPEAETAVHPLRHSGQTPSAVAQRLARELRETLRTIPALKVVDDACLKFADGGCTYPMSLAVVSRGGEGVAIDIEIDEPYTLPDFIPRHYIEDSSDSLRDSLFRKSGWAVVRFAEKQVAEGPADCCGYVAALINSLGLFPPIDTRSAAKIAAVRRFSRVSAENAVKAGYREGYLMREGFEQPEDWQQPNTAPLTNDERECAEANGIGNSRGPEPDNLEGYNAEHHFGRDDDISFIPETHTYLYKGCDALKSVTTVVSELFPAFDAQGIADRKAKEQKCSPEVFTDKWNLLAREAAETGTHMHAQIENYLLGRKTNSSFRLRFSSRTASCDKYVDVSKELSFFKNFISRAGLRPYRTEWRIFDTDARLAGSPDLVAEKNGQLLMFDWKRSTKVVDAPHSRGINGLPDTNCWGRHGFGAFAPLPDCSFVHYSLQQAVYRRILKKNYGLDIARAFLVVLHPQYTNFYIVETMDVEPYVDRIFAALR